MSVPAANVTAKVRVNVEDCHIYVIDVTPTTTLEQIVSEIQARNPAFEWNNDTHIFVNEGGTPMPWLNRTMIDYNNWDVERGYISALYLKKKIKI
jgi:hypothetical protein